MVGFRSTGHGGNAASWRCAQRPGGGRQQRAVRGGSGALQARMKGGSRSAARKKALQCVCAHRGGNSGTEGVMDNGETRREEGKTFLIQRDPYSQFHQACLVERGVGQQVGANRTEKSVTSKLPPARQRK